MTATAKISGYAKEFYRSTPEDALVAAVRCWIRDFPRCTRPNSAPVWYRGLYGVGHIGYDGDEPRVTKIVWTPPHRGSDIIVHNPAESYKAIYICDYGNGLHAVARADGSGMGYVRLDIVEHVKMQR